MFSAFVTFFLSLHNALYHPKFPVVPVIRSSSYKPPDSLTLPVYNHKNTSPELLAFAYAVVDGKSGEVLLEKNIDTTLFPASTTKIMTAIIALETMSLDSLITVPPDVTRDGSNMKLLPGEQISVRALLAGLLIHSSNDAADVLARGFPDGSYAGFIKAMNAKAVDLHLQHTHYQNPSGLIDPLHVTSVRDLLLLSRYAMQNPTFVSLVSQKAATVTSSDGKIVHSFVTTNELLGKIPGMEGIKTGWTQEAGECLVTQVTRNGNTILTAVLRSPDRFAETTRLIDWAYATHTWETFSLTTH